MEHKPALTGFILSALVLTGALGQSTLTASAGPDCTCRHSDGEIAEGQTACIKSPNGMTMARCERVLNNTSWKILDQPCPYSEALELDEKDFAMLSPAIAPVAELAADLSN